MLSIAIIYLIISTIIIFSILSQQGKGANAGTIINPQGSKNIFGNKGSSSFLFKLTFVAMLIFFIITIYINYAFNIDQNENEEELNDFSQENYNKQKKIEIINQVIEENKKK